MIRVTGGDRVFQFVYGLCLESERIRRFKNVILVIIGDRFSALAVVPITQFIIASDKAAASILLIFMIISPYNSGCFFPICISIKAEVSRVFIMLSPLMSAFAFAISLFNG